MADLASRPYNPDPAACCEACVFGRGEHAEWCDVGMDVLVSEIAGLIHEAVEDAASFEATSNTQKLEMA